LKCRVPVNTMAMPSRSQASMDSWSRMDPPGWMILLMPAAAAGTGDGTPARVLASDAFFPFADVVEAAAAAGIKSIIQPGGSIRDQESIDACDRLGIAMVFTGTRHFKH